MSGKPRKSFSGNGEEPRKTVPLTEKDGKDVLKKDPVLKDDLKFDKMHHDFLETHDYLKKSISDLDFLRDRIKSIREEDSSIKEKADNEAEEEFYEFNRDHSEGYEEVDQGSSRNSFRDSPEFKRRKIINKAKVLVKRHLLSKGFSREELRKVSHIIDERVEEFLMD